MRLKTISIFNRLGQKIGMDGAIAYSSAARVFQAFAGVISIFVIAIFLTGDEQGYYFTFGSILAIQTFFELGFTDIITQYVAHEAVHLNILEGIICGGDVRYRSRLSHLIRFCIKWYLVIAIAFFIVVNVVGFYFFSSYGSKGADVDWKLPWLLLSSSTALKLFQSPFTSIFNGLGYVKNMMRITFYQQLILPISQWLLFFCGFKLYVIGISSFLGVFVWFIFVYKSELRSLFQNLLRENITERISYFKEIFPYQWKIALSWISGFFITQLFNPVLFAAEGAVVAGQMGMTVHVLNAIQGLVLSWQTTKVPVYSGWIEMKQYVKLDCVFNKTTYQVMLICITLLAIMFCGVGFLRITHIAFKGNELGNRFLDYLPMLILFIPYILSLLVGSWAIYLRCHKQEPYLVTSIISGALQCASVFFLGSTYGLYGMLLGYASIILIMTPINYLIFKRKKIEWHT